MGSHLDPFTYDEDYALIEMILAHHILFNKPQMDGHDCCYCHNPIPVVRKGKEIDRSNRVDCDKGHGRASCLCSFHVKCWIKAVRKI